MIPPVSGDALTALGARWREASAHEFDELGNTQYASALDQCADDLDALIAAGRSAATTEGTWPEHCEQRAFVEGAKWQIWKEHGATAWSRERQDAEDEAVQRYGVPAPAPLPAPTAEDV